MKWISVKDQLPPLNQWVVLLEDENTRINASKPASVGRRYKLEEDDKESYYSCSFTPSHWMSVPFPPERK